MVTMKELNEFAESRGYRDWVEFKTYEDIETVKEARKMIERGLLMNNKYVVSQEFMNELEEWKNNLTSSKRIYHEDISELYSENVIRHWWQGDGGGTDANNRLITIIRWVNGEDVFEVEKPNKWVVRSKHTSLGDSNWYLLINWESGVPHVYSIYDKLTHATRFDTKEEAESWANSHQEVIEVVEV